MRLVALFFLGCSGMARRESGGGVGAEERLWRFVAGKMLPEARCVVSRFGMVGNQVVSRTDAHVLFFVPPLASPGHWLDVFVSTGA